MPLGTSDSVTVPDSSSVLPNTPTLPCGRGSVYRFYVPAVRVALKSGLDRFALLPDVCERKRPAQTLNLIEGIAKILKNLAGLERQADLGGGRVPSGSADCEDGGWNPAARH